MHTLKCRSNSVVASGVPLRVQTELSARETESLRKTLKAQGFTFSHIMEAAVALATFELNPPEDPDAHITFGLSMCARPRALPRPALP